MTNDPYRLIAGVYDILLEPLNEGLRGLGMKYAPGGEGVRVVDVCCGTGIHLGMYREAGCQVVGVDMSPAMVARSRRRLGESAVVLADATSLPFGPNEFDIAICMLALHEMSPDVRTRVVTDMGRVLRSGGKMVLIDFHPGPLEGLKGRIASAVITVAEFFAGREHFRNSRQFLRSGGLAPLIATHGLLLFKNRVVAVGTLTVTVCTKPGRD